jgi:hypothetical protein
MDLRQLHGGALASPFRVALTALELAGFASGMALAGFGSAAQARDRDADPVPLVVPKAKCGPNDHPETALQGQVPAALRAAGFQGFNCNLELLSQSKIDGANWQSAEFREANHGRDDQDHDGDRDRDDRGDRNRDDTVCAYHGTASPALSLPTRNPATFGVPVIDITNPRKPVTTGFLQTTSMLDPWESLKVNERRQLLGADNGQNGGGGPEVDIYDLSQDCRFPQLLASLPVGTGTDGSGIVHRIVGHEGTWARDGLTYYGGDLRFQPNPPTGSTGQYYAVDTSDPTRPKLITTWTTGVGGANVHGMSISNDGKRGYFVSLGTSGGPAGLTDPTVPANNGLLIYDLSQIQARKPNPQVKLISQLLWKDGSVAQHTIPVKIDGKSYVIFVDEGGSGGGSGATQEAAACAAGMPLFPMARIIDISDERHPKIVSKLGLEIHDPANCNQVLPDIVGLAIFTYGSHYCSVDSRENATTLACGYFNAGIRVFDIRRPTHPREIAYFNPPGTTVPSPGSNHNAFGQWRAGGPDWCSAQVHLNASNGTLWSTCQDNGVLVLKFTHGVWPFPETTTPAGSSED